MGERTAHLVDGVLGGLPVRQWVLTLPFRLRYPLAYAIGSSMSSTPSNSGRSAIATRANLERKRLA